MSDLPSAEPTSPARPEPILRPEARAVQADRSLAAMVLFVCTLGGMGIGFGSAMYLMRAQWGDPNAYPAAVEQEATTWIGISVPTAARFDSPKVLRVYDNTGAARAGFRSGDVVRSFDGVPIRSSDQLIRSVQARAPGEVATVGIERAGRPLVLHTCLSAR